MADIGTDPELGPLFVVSRKCPGSDSKLDAQLRIETGSASLVLQEVRVKKVFESQSLFSSSFVLEPHEYVGEHFCAGVGIAALGTRRAS